MRCLYCHRKFRHQETDQLTYDEDEEGFICGKHSPQQIEDYFSEREKNKWSYSHPNEVWAERRRVHEYDE